MALLGYKSSVKAISSGIAMTDEVTTATGASYQIDATTKRILDLNTPIVVKDGVTPTTEAYTIDYLNGKIIFETIDTRNITVTGAYLTPATIATADSFSFSGSAESLEHTVFGNEFKAFVAGLISGTATLGRFMLTDDIFFDTLFDGKYKIIEYYVTPTDIIRFYGIITGDTVDSDVTALVREEITFQVTTQIEV